MSEFALVANFFFMCHAAEGVCSSMPGICMKGNTKQKAVEHATHREAYLKYIQKAVTRKKYHCSSRPCPVGLGTCFWDFAASLYSSPTIAACPAIHKLLCHCSSCLQTLMPGMLR